MDFTERNQTLKKHYINNNNNIVLTQKNNGSTLKSRTSEANYRYSTPKRSPSPKTPRPVNPSSISAHKRAQSAERKRPFTPPSSPATPINDVSISVDIHLGSRKMANTRLPESVWPSRMRSLSVSFQSDSFSLPISKREKPITTALSDRTLKSSLNVSHKEPHPVLRKPSPERKRTPLKGKQEQEKQQPIIDQTENSKPVDSSLHSRLIDQHRWPSRNVSTRASNPQANPRRMSLNGVINGKPVQKSTPEGSGRVEFEGYSNSFERIVNPVIRSQSLPCNGLRPQSPNKPSLLSRGLSSPSRLRVSNMGPTRGTSPSQIRPASPTRQSNGSNSVLSFIADIKKGKKAANHIEDVHQLRLLYNGLLQWRYSNAESDYSLYCQKITAERTLYSVCKTTSELWQSVTEKRFKLQQLRLKLKLYSILNQQMEYLNEWALVERDHDSALSGSIKDLQASTLHLPVTARAMADIETVKAAVCSAVEVMRTIGSTVGSVLPKVEGMNYLVSELADVVAQERAMLDEYEALLATTEAMQMEENSLRTHRLQLQRTSCWELNSSLPLTK